MTALTATLALSDSSIVIAELVEGVSTSRGSAPGRLAKLLGVGPITLTKKQPVEVWRERLTLNIRPDRKDAARYLASDLRVLSYTVDAAGFTPVARMATMRAAEELRAWSALVESVADSIG